MTFRNLVVATDLSSAAEPVYRWAAALAQEFELHITLLNVDETSGFQWPPDSLEASTGLKRFLSDLSERREARLDSVGDWFADKGVRVSPQTGVGKASERILEHMAKRPQDLLIMGRRGTRHERNGIGGTTLRVLRRVATPTLVVPRECWTGDDGRGPFEHRRMMATTAFTSSCLMALDTTLEVAAKLRAKVDCVHVIKLPLPFAVTNWPEMVSGETKEQLEHLHAADLSLFAENAAAPCHPYATIGTSVATALRDAALESSIDLIAMPSHSSGKKHPPRFGSTTEAVIRHAPVPVLVWPLRFLEQRSFGANSPS